jgi:hypothetical protein
VLAKASRGPARLSALSVPDEGGYVASDRSHRHQEAGRVCFPPLAHVAVTVTDLERSTRWYTALVAATSSGGQIAWTPWGSPTGASRTRRTAPGSRSAIPTASRSSSSRHPGSSESELAGGVEGELAVGQGRGPHLRENLAVCAVRLDTLAISELAETAH